MVRAPSFRIGRVREIWSLRLFVIATLLLAALATNVQAQDWALDLFPVRNHDFGNVAKSSKQEFRFHFKNLYNEDIVITDVRSSCGCTRPDWSPKGRIKKFQEGDIIAAFNTETFSNYHSATLTVSLDVMLHDGPLSGQVQLTVSGNILGDVIIQPSFVDLGNVPQGTDTTKRVSVTRYNSPAWQLTDVRSLNPNFEVEVIPTTRNSAQVTYDLAVRLKGTAPAGFMRDQLILVTNSTLAGEIPIDVEGMVVAEVTVSEKRLAFVNVPAGKTITKNLVIRAQKPFKILNISCDDPAFKFKPRNLTAAVQVVPVTFTAPNKSGKIQQKLQIETDLGPNRVPEVLLFATVLAPPPESTADALKPQSKVETTLPVRTETVGVETAKPKSGAPSATPDTKPEKKATDAHPSSGGGKAAPGTTPAKQKPAEKPTTAQQSFERDEARSKQPPTGDYSAAAPHRSALNWGGHFGAASH